MFGKNPIRESEVTLDGLTLAVQELFYTIQGEGPQSGRPAVFIRLAGCNLACAFCDTEFESGINARMGVNEIINQVCQQPHFDLVVLTGGEPLRQNVVPLITGLLDAGVQLVQIETAGTLWVPGLEDFILRYREPRIQLVCSPKTPKIHADVQRYCQHYKYVIEADRTSDQDGLPSMGTQTRNLALPQTIFRPWGDPNVAWAMGNGVADFTIWVSPCDAHELDRFELIPGEPTSKNTQHAVHVAMKYGYRLSLQTHKLVGLP